MYFLVGFLGTPAKIILTDNANNIIMEPITVLPSKIVRGNLQAMNTTKQEFIRVDSCEWMKQVIHHNVHASEESNIQGEDAAFHKKTKKNNVHQ